MKRTRPDRTELVTETLDLRMPADAIDLARLRERFARLFDRAATAVHRAGHDLDDVIVDRFIVCESAAGQRAELGLELLSRRGHLGQQIARAFPAAPDASAQASPVAVVAAGVRVWLDRPG